MSMTSSDEIKRWAAKCKVSWLMEIIQGKTTVAGAARSFEEAEDWFDKDKHDMESVLRTKPIQEVYGDSIRTVGGG